MSVRPRTGYGELAGQAESAFNGAMGRMLIGAGVVLIMAGVLVLALGRVGLPLGRLPGDFAWRGRNVSFFAPLGTSLLLSVLLSLLLWLISYFRR